MLQIKDYKDLYLPLEKIEFNADIKSNNLILHFNCEDGVDFDIKINNKYNNSFNYVYTIPRGMSGQTYHITLKDNNGYVSNEVTLKVEVNIIKYNVIYDNKEIVVEAYNDIYENKFYLCIDELNELFIDSYKHKDFERLSVNKLMINNAEKRYYTYKHLNKLFMFVNDIKNVYDIDFVEKDDLIIINDREKIDIEKLDNEFYFGFLHGCLLGNIDTGEIMYSKNERNVCAIASTTKLLTLFITREKIEEGFFNYDTLIEIPEESEYESLTEDGVVYLEKGKMVPLKELMIALMLPSSNESAIALAHSISGSEKEFATLMNKYCAKLGLENSKFYNASGLPYYEDKLSPAKLQNRMTAVDMFKLVRVMINKYPDLLEITSLKKCHLDTLDVTLTNTNPVLFNMKECVGLKTGTTNRAGCCLVSLCNFNNTRIVSIVFGAENSSERGEVSETLMKYAKYRLEHAESLSEESKQYNLAVESHFSSYSELNGFIMTNTSIMCKNDSDLISYIEESKRTQYIVFDEDKIDIEKDKATTNIVISKERTYEAAKKYKDGRTAVLNFADAFDAGGYPWSSRAQEECLCRTSTLYPCLLDKSKEFYEYHKQLLENNELDYIANDDLIYTPNVCVFKSDEVQAKILPNSKRFFVNVISCAAPNLIHPKKESTIEWILRKRIEKILRVAKYEKINNLILGAFGCGAFYNDPKLVAKIFKEELEKYYFENVEFAIFCNKDETINYDIFKKILDK